MTLRRIAFDAVELFLHDRDERKQQQNIMCTMYTKINAVNCFESGNMEVVYLLLDSLRAFLTFS